MPLQNRVNPFAEIEAVSSHGMFMGNRGVLHGNNRDIRRPFKLKRWICCLTRFKGRKRIPYSLGSKLSFSLNRCNIIRDTILPTRCYIIP